MNDIEMELAGKLVKTLNAWDETSLTLLENVVGEWYRENAEDILRVSPLRVATVIVARHVEGYYARRMTK